MGRRLTLMVAMAVALALMLSACTEADIADYGSALLSVSADLDEDPRPDVRAAGSASDAVEREKESTRLMGEAIGEGGKLDFVKIEKAIDLSPLTASYRLHKAVMQVAAGQDHGTSLGQARFLVQVQSPYPAELLDVVLVKEFVLQLRRAMDSYPNNSAEYGRLQSELCAQARFYDKQYKQYSSATSFSTYPSLAEPSEGC